MTTTCKERLKQNLIAILTFVSVTLAIGIGFAIRSQTEWTPRKRMYLGFPGEIFLRVLKSLIVPLIVSSLVTALGNMEAAVSGTIGLRAVAFYLSTLFLSVLLGITVVMTIRPGDRVADLVTDNDSSSHSVPQLTTADSVLDLFRKIFPDNIVEACTHSYTTVLTPPIDQGNLSNSTIDISEWKISGKMESGMNILGLVMTSVVVGIVLAKLQERGKPLLDIFICINDVIMIVARVVIGFTPVGLFFLVISKIVEISDLAVMAQQVGMYSVTVLTGIFAHACILLPLIYFILTRQNPYEFYWKISEALLTAFATASSAATLPVTFKCLEEKVGLDRRVTRFCLPIGATLNMDGTALYEAVAALYIAQVRNISLDAGKIIVVSITATAASVGASGIPQAGLVTLVIVINSLGLPPEDIALILIVDWILDRFRTTLNVIGDATGAAVVAHFCTKTLDAMELPEMEMPKGHT